jgi:predicted glycoside hydrolase/deacetylase ChbG (UPF0249 family)
MKLLSLSWFKIIFILALVIVQFPQTSHSQDRDIKLIIRVDDMGAAHSVNEAIIETYQDGIATAVEVMVPTPWFPEAVKMLKENPQFDVGIHLSLTSEWENVKWRPLTNGKSFVDENGYFYPITQMAPFYKGFPPNSAFLDSDWIIEEVEAELRAQIEMALKHIDNVTHVSAHMGAATSTPELAELTKSLAQEYGLDIDLNEIGARRTGEIGSYKEGMLTPTKDRIQNFIDILNNLEPGVWLFVEHPAYDDAEMQAIHHLGYEHVAFDRQAVTDLLTNKEVRKVIEERGIQLVSYADLKEE